MSRRQQIHIGDEGSSNWFEECIFIVDVGILELLQ